MRFCVVSGVRFTHTVELTGDVSVRIRSPEWSRFGPIRTYFTETDPVVRTIYDDIPRGEKFADRLKIQTLVNDTITVAGSHIIGSAATFELLAENRSLLEVGAVVPAINDQFDSFHEMVELKLTAEEYTPPWAPKRGYPDAETMYERAGYLDDHASVVMGWSIDEMRRAFQESLLRELHDPEAPLRQRVASVTDPDRLCSAIESTDDLTRKSIYNLTDNLPLEVRSALLKYANVNYHLTGATVHRAVPNVHSQELELLREKFDRAIDIDATRAEMERPSLEVGFDEYLNVFGVQKDTIRRLDADAVADMHDSRISRRFRGELTEILANVSTSSERPHDWDDTREEFREAIEQRIERERHQSRRLKRGLKTVVYASTIGTALAGVEELSLSITVLDPVVERLVERLPTLIGNDFLAFKQQYQRKIEP